ncbi:hypothetical protein HZS_7602 [Henneguya salminicola]|nr:hypothetical protein HZS_7602 [Henneguya salminicola]
MVHYSKTDVIKSLSNVHLVSFNQKIKISNLTFYPASSGYAIGSCLWIIETINNKIVYMGKTCTDNIFLPPFQAEHFNSVFTLIVGFQPQQKNEFKLNYSKIMDICKRNIEAKGSILIPELPSGIFLNLLSDICSLIQNTQSFASKIYFVSPVSKACLKYANIYPEW